MSHNLTVIEQIGQIQIHGNIVDDGWFQRIQFENGKPHMNAILILSEVIYWYRPIEVKDEETGRLLGFKKKFKADKLQKSYQAFAEKFGITKKQAKLACDHLVKMGLIDIEFRTIAVGENKKCNNVMYIEPNPEKIKSISSLYNIENIEEDEIIEPNEEEREIHRLRKEIEELKKQNEQLKQEKEEQEEEQEEEHSVPNEPKVEEFKKLPREAIKLSIHLIKRIKENFPRQPLPDIKVDDSNKKLLTWSKEIEKINRLGPPSGEHGYSWEEIREVIDWTQDNDFWKGNILSAGKLREKIITLTAQMSRSRREQPTGNENLSREILEIGRQLQEDIDNGREW